MLIRGSTLDTIRYSRCKKHRLEMANTEGITLIPNIENMKNLLFNALKGYNLDRRELSLGQLKVRARNAGTRHGIEAADGDDKDI